MVSSQARGGATQAWWACTGSTNRGFVSLDPERQCEVDSGPRAPKRSPAGAYTFEVQRAAASARPSGRGTSAARKRKTPGEPGG